ncbi:MAG TPA: PRC-barrel domain-containing protein [Mycobacteriales bacterium]
MFEQNELSAALIGVTVRDDAGAKVGTVTDVYLDDRTGAPEWVTVRTGLFGTKVSLVPLAAARFDGAEILVAAGKDTVTGAPQVDQDGHLSAQQAAELYHHYGIGSEAGGRRTA